MATMQKKSKSAIHEDPSEEVWDEEEEEEGEALCNDVAGSSHGSIGSHSNDSFPPSKPSSWSSLKEDQGKKRTNIEASPKKNSVPKTEPSVTESSSRVEKTELKESGELDQKQPISVTSTPPIPIQRQSQQKVTTAATVTTTTTTTATTTSSYPWPSINDLGLTDLQIDGSDDELGK